MVILEDTSEGEACPTFQKKTVQLRHGYDEDAMLFSPEIRKYGQPSVDDDIIAKPQTTMQATPPPLTRIRVLCTVPKALFYLNHV